MTPEDRATKTGSASGATALLARSLAAIGVAASVAALAGCAGLGVQPWDRDVLARDDMQLTSDPLEASLDEHIYFSKEASSGGRGFGGGGCGCN
ncbi:MAG: DUF4266 domain-containing protein [Gammaproteobacteria bacterium]|nr:DUF4266 domain-containing protein [Gammaproteobacteria bacterium]